MSVSSHKEKAWKGVLKCCQLFPKICMVAEVYNISNGHNIIISIFSEVFTCFTFNQYVNILCFYGYFACYSDFTSVEHNILRS